MKKPSKISLLDVACVRMIAHHFPDRIQDLFAFFETNGNYDIPDSWLHDCSEMIESYLTYSDENDLPEEDYIFVRLTQYLEMINRRMNHDLGFDFDCAS